MMCWKSKISLSRIFIILSILLLFGCSKKIYDVVYPALNDGRYDSEFPYRNASKQLEGISNSVKMLNYIVYYKAHIFDENQNIRKVNINNDLLKSDSEQLYFNETVSGTATIMYFDERKVGLLTCAHVGNYPDTVYTFFNTHDGNKTDIIQQVAIKVRENYFVNEIPGSDEFKIIASDKNRDLAFLAKNTDPDKFQQIRQFKYPIGESKNLELGSFVYIIGYPMGHKMITKGIVSNTRDDKSDSFLIDALFNRGFSGGIILAIKDGVPNFELVGIAKSVSAKSDYFLAPVSMNGETMYSTNNVYRGNIHMKKHENINYGITYTISTAEIIEFFKDNSSVLKENGFDLEYLYNN